MDKVQQKESDILHSKDVCPFSLIFVRQLPFMVDSVP